MPGSSISIGIGYRHALMITTTSTSNVTGECTLCFRHNKRLCLACSPA